ncbi:hypothetical protein F5Y11DRAFT_351757 [Daldinia sp. FL1419]|nr:hypothetical protein F5Y11DRAFT_351757 [Daldinia sp. FL1419]
MYFKTALVSAVAFLLAGQTMGAALTATNARSSTIILLETILKTSAPGADVNLVAACNCPNNCSHKEGSSCKYYSGPSDKSSVVHGKCRKQNGFLMCTA